MRAIGLTGGIASGKSTVSAILAEQGAIVIDADQLGHRSYAPDTPTFDAVVATFGSTIVAHDGVIDRAKLGAQVFADPGGLKKLTDIVWPAIRDLAHAELQRLARQGTDVSVLEAAVMIEAGWQDLVDEVWVVSVPTDIARQRLMARNGLSAEDADSRIAAQIGNAEREAEADVVIDTDCSLEQVRERVLQAWIAFGDRVGATG